MLADLMHCVRGFRPPVTQAAVDDGASEWPGRVDSGPSGLMASFTRESFFIKKLSCRLLGQRLPGTLSAPNSGQSHPGWLACRYFEPQPLPDYTWDISEA